MYRLPTEAEWEYAARAGSQIEYAGSIELGDGRLVVMNKSQDQTHEVGLKAPNEWGLYDMSGNVLEWCQDGYSDNLLSGVF